MVQVYIRSLQKDLKVSNNPNLLNYREREPIILQVAQVCVHTQRTLQNKGSTGVHIQGVYLKVMFVEKRALLKKKIKFL